MCITSTLQSVLQVGNFFLSKFGKREQWVVILSGLAQSQGQNKNFKKCYRISFTTIVVYTCIIFTICSVKKLYLYDVMCVVLNLQELVI